ncbi:hypothetical protein HY837_05800 [archaeon]|nr:hypothetical protein [archaeon]
MKKSWFLLIAVLLLFIIGCALSPKILPSKKSVCGNNILEPTEKCDKATNQGCSYGSFCSEDCRVCNQGVFCCTDKSELGAGGSLYYASKKDLSQCTSLIEEENCFSITEGNAKNATKFYTTQTEAALGCSFGYTCFNNTLVKLCGEDYQEAIRSKAEVYTNKIEALERAPCKPAEKNQTNQENKTEEETALNIIHNLKIQPRCEEKNIRVEAELAGELEKIDQVQFSYAINGRKTRNVIILTSIDKEFNTYAANLTYTTGNYEYALQVKTKDNTLQTLTKDNLVVEECKKPETKSFCNTSSEYDGWCYFFNLVPVDSDSYNTGNCVTSNFPNSKEMCEYLAKSKGIPELLNQCKEKTDSSERDKCYGAIGAVIQDLKTCDVASSKDLCYYGYAIKYGFIMRSNKHNECDRINDSVLKTQCKEYKFIG